MTLTRLATRALRLLDPEDAHGFAIRALGRGLVRKQETPADPRLAVQVWGRDFANPIGLAAGFDKNAAVPAALLGLGFGFVEVGTVTPRPQAGNPRPRIFRLAEDGALINRLGFNNEGVDAAARRLRSWERTGPLGINVGMNKESNDAAADYAYGVERLARFADYLVINVSSPNTPGLRELQKRAELENLITRIQTVLKALPSPPPLVLKIAPDLSERALADIAEVACDLGLDGLSATNTTLARPDSLQSPHQGEAGGLSGRPLMAPATEILRQLYQLTEGRLPLIGIGGIASGADAYAKIRAGASLVQLYTAFVYQGPDLIPRISKELATLLARDGFERLSDAIGADPPLTMFQETGATVGTSLRATGAAFGRHDCTSPPYPDGLLRRLRRRGRRLPAPDRARDRPGLRHCRRRCLLFRLCAPARGLRAHRAQCGPDPADRRSAPRKQRDARRRGLDVPRGQSDARCARCDRPIRRQRSGQPCRGRRPCRGQGAALSGRTAVRRCTGGCCRTAVRVSPGPAAAATADNRSGPGQECHVAERSARRGGRAGGRARSLARRPHRDGAAAQSSACPSANGASTNASLGSARNPARSWCRRSTSPSPSAKA